MKKLIVLGLTVLCITTWAQETFPVNDVMDERHTTYAFTNATIFRDYQTKLENSTVLIQDGKVTAIGANVSVPSSAVVLDMEGKWIYPAFVDPYTNYGLPEVKRGGFGGQPQYDSKKEGAFGWNEAIKSDYDAVTEFKVDSKSAKKMRDQGFGAAVAFRPDGIMRGTSVFTLLGDGPEQDMVLSQKASSHLSFNKGSSRQLYPTSIMGMVALIRQTYLDADWYQKDGKDDQTNASLAAVTELRALPQIFEANSNKLRVLLADKVGDEFGIQYIMKGNGDEYQRLDEIRKTGAPIIIPVNFPKAYDVEDPLDALEISLADLKHWEMAPSNAKLLTDQGVEIAFTTHGLKEIKSFLPNVRKTVQHGLSESDALKAITYTPAKLIGMSNEVGNLKVGSRANMIISAGNIFNSESTLFETWVGGRKYVVNDMNATDLAGKYELSFGENTNDLEITGSPGKQKAKIIINDSTSVDGKLKVSDQRISLSFELKDGEGVIRLSGWLSGNDLTGTGQDQESNWISWKATFKEEGEKKEKKENEIEEIALGDIIYPFVAYGNSSLPSQETLLFKNATLWTLEGEGKVEGADILIQGGKIAEVGKDLSASGARVVDATGKHITPGVIDEHSHAALSGVNESSHSVTAEVRMYDAVDSEDIDIYRQLAGGVTAAQLLHGSANPVGGQSALIKFRWGEDPNGLKIEGADEYIKFALGENVKQSNRSSQWVTRFPQTRMGVEQVYMDAFTRAKSYDSEWNAYNSLSNKAKTGRTPPRKDIQMEALAEILNSERFITCHSYVQSEINMLMKVAEKFDFTVNTFTHILEGYKVADKMAEHGVGGSTFSDWWAYKYEVKDAIPYNPALMTQAGVTVAINSDDSEMARRLNQEAAKSIKYGSMQEIEALKMVTLNPAKLLHLDDRMGSLKVGKDGDIVLWSDHPLSIYAKAEMTLVDGKVYFDSQKDEDMRETIRTERTRIINKMRSAKKSGAKTQKYKAKERHRYHCEDFVDSNSLND